MSLDAFLKVIDRLPEAILLVAGDGVVFGANRRLAPIGLDPTEVSGKRLCDIAVEPPETISEYLRQCARTSEPVPGSITFKGHGGKTVACRSHGNLLSPRSDVSEAIIMLRLISKEVSVRQFATLNDKIDELGTEILRRTKVEHELREQKERLEVTLASIGDAVMATDAEGRIVMMNPVAESLCRWPQDEALGRPLKDVFHIVNEKTRLTVESPVDKVFREGRIIGLANHTVLIGRDKQETAIDDSAAPIIDRLTNVSGVVLVFRDVAERRAAQQIKDQLAAIVESSDDIIISKTLDGIITSWNRGAERILGYSANEVMGKHVSMLMPPENIEDIEIILGRIRAGEKVDHYETKRRRKDGVVIDVTLTVAPIRDAEGDIIGASKVGRDITDAKAAAELKDRLAAIVESSDDIIISKTLDGIITSWNRGAERTLGYSADEVVGKHVSMLMPPENIEDTEKILGRIRQGEKIEHYETRRRRKDGVVIDVTLTVSPIRSHSGNIIGASKIGRDITQQKLMETERKEADRRKDEFLAMLAHELRNPLASINNAVQLFGRFESEEELEWAREVVLRHVKHLGRLIDDLLDVSRITRGKISLRNEALNLSPIVSSAVETVRPLIEDRKHELNVSLSPGALRLRGDPLRLEQILVNLLTNAAKYTDAGGRIWLTASREQNDVVVKIRDTGMGLTPDLLPRIFDLFAQGDRSAARSEGGLGIGLTVVKSLVESHGGSVTARSEGAGKGSEFTVRLPALEHRGAATTRPMKSPPRVAVPSSRVLVVDDNKDTAVGVSKLLRLLGHDVRIAHDGHTAVEEARSHNPEVVLLDIGLPGMDGYEVVKRLRTEECCKNALIIAISGYGQEDDIRRSRGAGFDHHLIKPVDFDALMSLLSRHVSG